MARRIGSNMTSGSGEPFGCLVVAKAFCTAVSRGLRFLASLDEAMFSKAATTKVIELRGTRPFISLESDPACAAEGRTLSERLLFGLLTDL